MLTITHRRSAGLGMEELKETTPPHLCAMTNYERMVQLADEVFAIHEDPAQLQVDDTVLERLQLMHPATRGELIEGDGPIVWLLVMPTTTALMEAFLAGELSEHELYERTPVGVSYDALYLCSVLVLPEHRGRGLAEHTTRAAIAAIRKDHPIGALFCWTFSDAGAALAARIAQAEGLPLHVRPHGAGGSA